MSQQRKATPRKTSEKHCEPNAFTAYVYKEDLRKIRELVQPYPDIETGGDLFGLWQDDRTVIIQRFIGPGEKCKRTPTSFHQDVDYLHRVGSLITTEEGLCNVGEWHSHHQIGMPKPSGADRRTVFSNMPHLGLERFVLFIATIDKTGERGKKRSKDVKLDEITLHPYLFINSTQDVFRGKIEIIPGKNPHDMNTKTENEIKKGAEESKNGKKPAPTSDKKSNGKTKHDPHAGQDQEKGKSRDSGSQAQRREIDKKENQSPNPNNFSPPPPNPNNFYPPPPNPNNFFFPQNVASQGTDHSISGYMPPTTSATAPSLGKTWEDSLKLQTAQQTGQPPYKPPTQPLQHTSFSPPSGASGNAGAGQERGRGSSEHYSWSNKPSHTSQTSPETYPEQQKRTSRDQVRREKQAQHTKQTAGSVGITNMTGGGFF